MSTVAFVKKTKNYIPRRFAYTRGSADPLLPYAKRRGIVPRQLLRGIDWGEGGGERGEEVQGRVGERRDGRVVLVVVDAVVYSVVVVVVLVVLVVLVLVVVVVVSVLVVVVVGGRWWWCVWWYWYSCWCVRGSSVGGDGGAKVLERVGAWWLWGVGGGGYPNSVHAAGYKKKLLRHC